MCGSNIPLKKEALGKKIRCKLCNEISEIPADLKSTAEIELETKNQAIPEKATKNPNEMECPVCFENIPVKSQICPRCKEVIVKKRGKVTLSKAESDELLIAHKNELSKEINMMPKKMNAISIGTIVLFITSCLLFISAIGVYFDSIDNLPGSIALSVFGIFFVLGAYSKFNNNKKAINIGNISDPQKFITQYFESIKSNRLKYIYQVVSPNGRTKNTSDLMGFKKISVEKSKQNLSSLAGYIKYWSVLIKGFGNYAMRMTFHTKKDIKIIEKYDDKVIFQINLTFKSHNQLLWLLIFLNLIIAIIVIAVTTKSETLTIRKTIFKHNNKWYVAEGEMQGNLDLATFKSELNNGE